MHHPMSSGSRDCAPFLVSLMPQYDQKVIEQARLQSRHGSDSYDPYTQTSVIPLQAGTARTYDDTFSGIMWSVRDDDEVSDT